MPKTDKKAKKKNKPTGPRITSKTQFKDVEKVMEIVEQKADVATKNGLPSTYTKIQLPNGTIKETYGERYGKPDNS